MTNDFAKKILKRKKKEMGNKFSAMSIVLLVILCIYVLSLVALFFWAFLTAFKDNRLDIKVNHNTYGFPTVWVPNFMTVFGDIKMGTVKGDVGFLTILWNSLLYSLGGAFLKTLVPCLTAYACARFKFKSSKIVYTAVLITMMTPIVGSLPSELKIAYALGIYDTIWGVWIMSANMLGLYFFVMYSAFKAVPMGYTEAAKIDGAGNMMILTRVIFPMVSRLFLTVLLINFVEFWNNYQTPQVYLPNHPTLGYTLYYFVRVSNDASFATLPNVITLAFIIVLPILILFLIFQGKLMGNLTLGGLKG